MRTEDLTYYVAMNARLGDYKCKRPPFLEKQYKDKCACVARLNGLRSRGDEHTIRDMQVEVDKMLAIAHGLAWVADDEKYDEEQQRIMASDAEWAYADAANALTEVYRFTMKNIVKRMLAVRPIQPDKDALLEAIYDVGPCSPPPLPRRSNGESFSEPVSLECPRSLSRQNGVCT